MTTYQATGPQQSDIVTVPDMPAAALSEYVNKAAELRWMGGQFLKWNYIQDEVGKTYAVRREPYRRGEHLLDVRKRLVALGFTGITAAFLVLMALDKPWGHIACVPPDERLWRPTAESTSVRTPYYCHQLITGTRALVRTILMHPLHRPEDDDGIAVGFMEMKKA